MIKALLKMLDFFFLLRIPLLAPVWTILILGWITGSSNAFPGGNILNQHAHYDNAALWWALLGFSLLVASIYVVNQIMDIESDRINHKLFLLPHGLVSVRSAWILATLCAASGLAIAYRFDMVVFTLFLASLVLGFLYNLPPARLKNRAWGGVLAAALGHGTLTFLVGWYVAKLGTPVTAEIAQSGLLSSLSPSLANGAVFLATTVPDAAGDRVTGKRTFCVKYGERYTAALAAILCAGALVTAFSMEHNAWVMAVSSSISMIFFVYFAVATRRDLAFKAFKWPVFLLSAFVAVFVPEYGILILLTFVGSRIYYKRRFGIDYPTFKAK